MAEMKVGDTIWHKLHTIERLPDCGNLFGFGPLQYQTGGPLGEAGTYYSLDYAKASIDEAIATCRIHIADIDKAANKQPKQPAIILELYSTIRDLLGVKYDIGLIDNRWMCMECGREYDRADVPFGALCSSEDCPRNMARAMLAKAETL